MTQSPTLDAAAKQKIKDALVQSFVDDFNAAKQTIESEIADAKLDQEDNYSIDDQVHADQAGDMAALYEQAVAKQQQDMAQVEALDFAVTDSVAPGAVIGLGGDRFVVGVVASEFDVDGVTYEGLSADSPLYAEMAGLKSGDSFTFRGKTQTIDFVA